MTIGGALSDLNNLLNADDIPCYYKPSIKAIMDTITLEQEPSYNSVNSLAESKLKNPKAKTFDILHFVADNAGLSTFEAIEKAYHLGVSEQENVIDKIRAEILRISSYGGYELGGYKDGYLNAMVNVLSIIDKHTIGSEKE